MTASRSARFCSLVLLAASPAWALDPSKRIAQSGHTSWRTRDGYFGGLHLTSIAQTRDGFLWIATDGGLFRFDGARFSPWSPPDGQLLPATFPARFRLTADRDGGLWIGAFAGYLAHWKDGRLVKYPVGECDVESVLEARDGTVWFACNATGRPGALCQVQGSGVQCHGESEGLQSSAFTSLAEDDAGDLWIGGTTALLRWTPAAHRAVRLPGLARLGTEPSQGVTALLSAPDGSMWLGTLAAGVHGLQRLVGGALQPFVATELQGSSLTVTALQFDHNGVLWVGTLSQGLYRVQGETVDRFDSADGLSADRVVQILEDREGTIWVATETGGLDRFRDVGVVSFGAREGLGTNVIDTVVASRDGTVWAGGEQALAAIRGGRVSSIRAGQGLPGRQVTSLLEDRAGRLWVGIDDRLTILRDGRFRRIDTPGLVVGLADDVDGSVWAEIGGSHRRLIRIQEERVTEVLPMPRIPLARRMASDPEGGVWLGLASGELARLRSGMLETFSFGHDPSRVPDVLTIGQIIVGRDRSILAAAAFGLIGWRNGTKRLLTMRNGLPCDKATGLVEDRNGGLWLATACGLLRLAPEELDRWWKDPDVQVHPRVLDVLDGWHPGFAFFQAAARSADGRLWFANGTVLQMVDPDHLPRNTVAPPVHIEDVVADGRSLPPSADLRLPALTRDLQISYTALSLAAPEKVRFRYRLEGRDTGWAEAGTRRQAFYNDLGPGDYRFRVIACNNDGVWNEQGAALAFTIAPAWYQTNVFRALCAVGGVVVLWALHRLRLRHVEARFQGLMNERLAERERIARALHDTLLQAITGLLLKVQAAANRLSAQEPVRQSLEQALARGDEMLAEGRDAVRGLRSEAPGTESLDAALSDVAEAVNRDGATAYNVTVLGAARPLHPIVREEVFQIAREALTNAFTHARAARVELEIAYGRKAFELRVRDDGAGIAPEITASGRPGHWGMTGMRERAARIGGRLNVWSREGAGTEIELAVRAKAAFAARRPGMGWGFFMKVLRGRGRG
jgi:signal transduction histidine kinase/ligand-binding sensor domain-containing protein